MRKLTSALFCFSSYALCSFSIPTSLIFRSETSAIRSNFWVSSDVRLSSSWKQSRVFPSYLCEHWQTAVCFIGSPILNPQVEPQSVSQVLQLFSSKCSVFITKPLRPTPYFRQIVAKLIPGPDTEIKYNSEAGQTQSYIMAHYKRVGVFPKHSSAKVMFEECHVLPNKGCIAERAPQPQLSRRGKQPLCSHTNKE